LIEGHAAAAAGEALGGFADQPFAAITAGHRLDALKITTLIAGRAPDCPLQTLWLIQRWTEGAAEWGGWVCRPWNTLPVVTRPRRGRS